MNANEPFHPQDIYQDSVDITQAGSLGEETTKELEQGLAKPKIEILLEKHWGDLIGLLQDDEFLQMLSEAGLYFKKMDPQRITESWPDFDDNTNWYELLSSTNPLVHVFLINGDDARLIHDETILAIVSVYLEETRQILDKEGFEKTGLFNVRNYTFGGSNFGYYLHKKGISPEESSDVQYYLDCSRRLKEAVDKLTTLLHLDPTKLKLVSLVGSTAMLMLNTETNHVYKFYDLYRDNYRPQASDELEYAGLIRLNNTGITPKVFGWHTLPTFNEVIPTTHALEMEFVEFVSLSEMREKFEKDPILLDKLKASIKYVLRVAAEKRAYFAGDIEWVWEPRTERLRLLDFAVDRRIEGKLDGWPYPLRRIVQQITREIESGVVEKHSDHSPMYPLITDDEINKIAKEFEKIQTVSPFLRGAH